MTKMDRRSFMAAAGVGSLGMGIEGAWGGGLAKTDKSEQVRQISLAETDERFDPWVEVRRGDIAWNYEQIKKVVRMRPIMGVIKANAYGHGLEEVGKLLESVGMRHLAVGKVEEAVRLREAGVKVDILNFGPYGKNDAVELVRGDITQSVYGERIRFLVDAARRLKKKAKVHIKLDTGLGREGVPYYEAGAFIEQVAQSSDFSVEGIFTGLTEDEEFDREQLRRLEEVTSDAVRKRVRVGMRHAASSAAILSSGRTYLDMVRPGIMLYGEYPSTKEYEARKVDLRPAMKVKARVAQIKTLRAGDTVSYHRVFTAEKKMTVATIPVGYSDGWPYQMGNKGEVIIQGRRCRMVAPVTANHMVVDVTGVERVAVGDLAVLMGEYGRLKITAEEIAAWAGSSVYKVLVGMGPLLPRLYI
ncbi:MAG: alanine racemase [Planctomycetes bacterium]|nr:alanine racemase [Planctomycetota bacterium]